MKSSPLKIHVHTAPDLVLPYHSVEMKGQTFSFAASGRVSEKRVLSYETKEPTTLAWIDTFHQDDVFIDVGANVGMYTVYAAKKIGCPIYAFEPEALNYAELNKNIYLNGLYDLVRAYCVGMSDEVGLSTLYLSRFAPSYSHHDARDNRFEGPVTKLVESAAKRPKQGCMTWTLDDTVSRGWIPPPTHIKIDVDGWENRVINGAAELLEKSPRLQSILVETDFSIPTSVAIVDKMAKWGWKYSTHQASLDRDGVHPEEEWRKAMASGRGGSNIIYFRDDKYARAFEAFAAGWKTKK